MGCTSEQQCNHIDQVTEIMNGDENKMKTAKEMFEELGYTKDDGVGFIFFRKYDYVIAVDTLNKQYSSYVVEDGEEISIYINLEEHLAIHQQMKELGWIE